MQTSMSDNILLVDDDPNSIHLLARILSDTGKLRFATSGEDALRLARESTPDLILLDAEMPGMTGFQVCEALKADPELADVPVIFITSHSGPEFEVSGFDLGAADFIAKPVSAPLVMARVRSQLRVKHMADELRRIASIDALTGIANRRRFDESLEHEWRRARRSGASLALLMIDVDHFKPFNDRYGHPAGDACLRSVAQSLVGTSLRPADLVARYGGEEFVVLLPETQRGGAEHVALAVLGAVEALGIAHEGSLTALHVTVSVGVACYDDESACWAEPSADSRFGDDLRRRCSPIELVQAADKALYSAKHAGRARARLLDIADVDAPQVARDIASSCGNRAPHRALHRALQSGMSVGR
ncbi:MAG: diguanylate cyclase [Burkholderiales bacterium]